MNERRSERTAEASNVPEGQQAEETTIGVTIATGKIEPEASPSRPSRRWTGPRSRNRARCGRRPGGTTGSARVGARFSGRRPVLGGGRRRARGSRGDAEGASPSFRSRGRRRRAPRRARRRARGASRAARARPRRRRRRRRRRESSVRRRRSKRFEGAFEGGGVFGVLGVFARTRADAAEALAALRAELAELRRAPSDGDARGAPRGASNDAAPTDGRRGCRRRRRRLGRVSEVARGVVAAGGTRGGGAGARTAEGSRDEDGSAEVASEASAEAAARAGADALDAEDAEWRRRLREGASKPKPRGGGKEA